MTANKIPNVVPDATERQAPATEPQTVVPETTVPQAPAPDPFNPTNLRLSQSFVETAGVKKLLTTVRVGKPSPLIVTFSNNAAGSAVAIKELEHRIRWKRALHGGQEIYPLTKLTDAPWKTGVGMRRRPDFPILGWRQFIDGQLRIVEPLSLEAELGDSVPF